MDHFADERDQRLLVSDKYTFAVLGRILRGECQLILSNHERFILCHSCDPYPVWLWTPDDFSPQEAEAAWTAAMAVCPLAAGYRYNMKYELAERFLAFARAEGIDAHIAMHMFAYDCPAPIAPGKPAVGTLHRCMPADMQEVAAFIQRFHSDIGKSRLSGEACLAKAAEHIDRGGFFFWKNADGAAVACCSMKPDGDLASVGSVYTLPEHRRRHYAQQLVYEVSRLAQTLGLTPTLYTDADYAASNACYTSIGYVLRGKLCTVAATEMDA